MDQQGSVTSTDELSVYPEHRMMFFKLPRVPVYESECHTLRANTVTVSGRAKTCKAISISDEPSAEWLKAMGRVHW